jgi:hypothetical protein
MVIAESGQRYHRDVTGIRLEVAVDLVEWC